MTPDVTIIIPCYNRALLIGDAIESALAQDCNTEVIVIDDGSSDDSWDSIARFGKAIRAIRTPNRGVSAARNLGIAEAAGRFVHFCDSDDCIRPAAIPRLLSAALLRREHEIVFGDAVATDLNRRELPAPRYGFRDAPTGRPLGLHRLLSGFMAPYLPLYPRRALRQVGGFREELSLGEDQEMAVRIAVAGYCFIRVPVMVVDARQHYGARLTAAGNPSFHRKLLNMYHQISDLLEREDLLGPTEASTLANCLWSGGRAAARDRCRAEAEALFRSARQRGRPSLAVANLHLRMLSYAFGPYWAERVLELAKRAIRRAALPTVQP